MGKSVQVILIFLCAGTLFGCFHPLEYPVISNPFKNDDTYNTLAITSERRIAYSKPEASKMRFCLEAPPDTSENIAGTISATQSLKATASPIVGGGSVGGNFDNQFANQFATALAFVNKPSQGIMYYRTLAGVMCNLYVNDVIDKHTYSKIMTSAADFAAQATLMELTLTEGRIGPQAISGNGIPSLGGGGTAPGSPAPAPAPSSSSPGAAAPSSPTPSSPTPGPAAAPSGHQPLSSTDRKTLLDKLLGQKSIEQNLQKLIQ